MEKNYLYNLYKNIKKYNLKINNNSYIINKINKLHGGIVDEAEAKKNIADLDALLKIPAAPPVPYADPYGSILEDLSREAEDFLRQFNEYKKKIESGISNITEDDISKLENIQKTFDDIKSKIDQLV